MIKQYYTWLNDNPNFGIVTGACSWILLQLNLIFINPNVEVFSSIGIIFGSLTAVLTFLIQGRNYFIALRDYYKNKKP